MVVILSIILSVILVGALLILKDLPFVSGTILASGAGERWSVRILAPVLLISGVALPILLNDNKIINAAGVFAPTDAGVILSIGLATFLAVAVTGRFSRFPAVAFAFMAALAGTKLASGESLDFSACASYVVSWIAAPALCALTAAFFYWLYAVSTKDRTIHLAILDARLLAVSTMLSFILLAAAAYNSSILLTFLPKATDIPMLAKAGIVVGSVVVVYPFIRKSVCQKKWDIADTELDINSQSVLAAMVAMVLTLVFFSSDLPGKIGLKATALPSGTLYIAALAGISVSRGRALVEGRDITTSAAATIISPLLGLISAFCLARVANGSWIGTAFIITLFLLSGIGFLLLRFEGDRDIQKGIILSRERQAYSTVTIEDVFYHLKKQIYRALDYSQSEDKMTDELLSSLRERMYFTSEINDFYARSEVLHRDFNRRLAEAFPNLTENERKLANLLRQGFSSKYIASLMNIAPKSVEINRYRLRAKLGLTRSDNLIKFIKSI